MNRWACVPAILALSNATPAQESVTVPWSEFRDLYRERVEREVRASIPKPEAQAPHVLEEALYRLVVGPASATASVSLSGRTYPGRPGPIALFTTDVILGRVETLQGGALIRGEGDVSFQPEGAGSFQLSFDLLLPVREDSRSKYVSLPVPTAVRNGVSVSLPAGYRLAAWPGIAGSDGLYYFAPARSLEVRFDEERAIPAPAAIEIDTLTRLELQGKKILLTTAFLSARPAAAPVTVRLPDGARFLASSLKGSWVREIQGNAVTIVFPDDAADDFTLQCVLDGEEAGEPARAFSLPVVEGNAGREGCFALVEPEDGEVTLAGALPAPEPASLRTRERVQALLGRLPARLMRVPRNGRLQLSVRRFDAVGTPDVVLDAIRLLTTFEEGGGALSVLSLEIPAAVGPRLRLRSVPGAEIWSLTVNGRKAGVYALDAERWIIPLADGEPSKVELAFLRRGPRLGLQGRVEAVLPASGLPARNVHIGICLPPRVELVSVEGDVAAAAGAAWPVPDAPGGTRHFFHRAYDRGEGLSAAFLYKEPADKGKER